MPVARLWIAAIFALAPSQSLAGGKQPEGHPCPVSVTAIRDKFPDERAAVLQLRYGVGSDPNSVPGPDSLRLVVDAPGGHPRVFIEDTRTRSRDDIVGMYAGLPTWSPDGRYIACVAYVSQEQPYELIVIERRTRRHITIDAQLRTDEYRWSPDSRWIAVEGAELGTNQVVLRVYDLARGRLRRVSTTSAFQSYGLSWSPDSKFLAFTKPTAVDEGEDETVLAADLWVVSTSSWAPCRLRATEREIESRPEWLSDKALLLKSVPSTSPQDPAREEVLELRRLE